MITLRNKRIFALCLVALFTIAFMPFMAADVNASEPQTHENESKRFDGECLDFHI